MRVESHSVAQVRTTSGVKRLHRIAIDSHRHVFDSFAPYTGTDPNSSSHNLSRICRIHDEPPVAGRGDDDQRPFRYGFEFPADHARIERCHGEPNRAFFYLSCRTRCRVDRSSVISEFIVVCVSHFHERDAPLAEQRGQFSGLLVF